MNSRLSINSSGVILALCAGFASDALTGPAIAVHVRDAHHDEFRGLARCGQLRGAGERLVIERAPHALVVVEARTPEARAIAAVLSA